MQNQHWDRIILDAAPPVTALAGLAVGDLDGDGHVEVLTGGGGGLLWYRPDTFEKGCTAEGRFGVGLALEDVDGDGIMEAVTGNLDEETNTWMINWYKPTDVQDLGRSWKGYVIDPRTNGNAHDIIFVIVHLVSRQDYGWQQA
jgi:hypothetical protein